MRMLIVGAGIGGLTAALALRQAGFDAHVYEQASVLREVGAGVAISPNAVKVLHRLGLAEALRAVGVVPRSLDSRDWQTGALLGRVPLAEAAVARWGAPFYHLHRADLHDALRAALGDRHITLGARCVAVEQHDTAVDGPLRRRSRGDGRSAHRRRRHPLGRPRPRRGTGPADLVAPDRLARPGARGGRARMSGWRCATTRSGGRARMFVCFYVAAGRLVNWVGNTQSDDDWQEESWSARGDRDEALRLFAGWHPQVRALIAGTEQVFKWALFDRPPLATWTRGRVTLLGDAAHPMLPYMAQGASQSIEDAFVLARCLAADRDDPQRAIEVYADRRRERTAAVQTASREAGRMMHLTDPAEVAGAERATARTTRRRPSPGSTGSGATTWRAPWPTDRRPEDREGGSWRPPSGHGVLERLRQARLPLSVPKRDAGQEPTRQ